VQVYVSKSGVSFFLDDDLDLMVFTHPTVKRGQFVYDSTAKAQDNMCPLSEHTCGDLCADFINYSPTGIWTVQVPTAQTHTTIAIEEVTTLRFEFQVTYDKIGTSGTTQLFNKSYPLDQDFGALCAEEDAVVVPTERRSV